MVQDASNAAAFRAAVIEWVRRAAGPAGPPGRFRFSAGADPRVGLLGSYFAALTLDNLDALQELPSADRTTWANYLADFQDPRQGFFQDPALRETDLLNARHTREHFRWHDTPFACAALYVLGAAPRHPMTYIHPFRNPDRLVRWLDEWDLAKTGAWLFGNWDMDLAWALLIDHRLTAHPGNRHALDAWFDWHERHVDPRTGFWGSDRGCTRHNAMCGAYHQYLVYAYEGRPLPHAARAIDAILALQNAIGLFGLEDRSGACEDLDALHSLVLLRRQTDYRREDMDAALCRALPALLAEQNPDGGFRYNRQIAFTQSGWRLTLSPPGESTMMATNFRVFTLSAMMSVLRDHPLARISWRYGTAPAHGFHPA